jgi:cytidylate kinase
MMQSKNLTIAIDGPAGAGKGTSARILADRLGLTHIDSGAMYRAVALAASRRRIKYDDESAVVALLPSLAIDFTHEGGHSHVTLNDEDIESQIRTPDISHGASVVSQFRPVRQFVVEKQRQLSHKGGVVMEGRDTGTVVFPDADLKIFLTATVEERARRRVADHVSRGQEADYDSTLEELKIRDQRDTDRAHSPLLKAVDAIEIVTDGLTIDEVVERLIDLAQAKQR